MAIVYISDVSRAMATQEKEMERRHERGTATERDSDGATDEIKQWEAPWSPGIHAH